MRPEGEAVSPYTIAVPTAQFVFRFNVGDRVVKTGGDYSYSGVVVSAFQKVSGAQRYVVEDARGLLFIFNESQLHKAKG